MSAKSSASGGKITELEITKPLEWRIPEGLNVVWANNVFVQHHEQDFLITFFQITPPLLIEPTPEEIEAIEKVPAIAVARIAMSPVQFEKLVEVFANNLEKWKSKQLGSTK